MVQKDSLMVLALANRRMHRTCSIAKIARPAAGRWVALQSAYTRSFNAALLGAAAPSAAVLIQESGLCPCWCADAYHRSSRQRTGGAHFSSAKRLESRSFMAGANA